VDICGAKNRYGEPCQHEAGWGTDHVGTGKCKLHGGNAGRPVEHGLYSARYASLKETRIKELYEGFQSDDEPLNLLPEANLLRALIIDYIERYEEYTDALIAWHSSFGVDFQTKYGHWQIRLSKWQEEWVSWSEGWQEYQKQVEAAQGFYRQGWPEPPDVPAMPFPPSPPSPEDFENKPRKVADILQVGNFIDKIGGLVERIQKQKQEGVITMVAFRAALQDMGAEVVKAAEETVVSEHERAALLASVESRWNSVRLPQAN